MTNGCIWTVPVDEKQVSDARNGNVTIFLTPSIPIPDDWLPSLKGSKVLCLASGGGQQGPLLAAAGANVVVFDNSTKQLSRDREVAEKESLPIETVQGDMRDLTVFPDDTFDLIVHPVSNSFIPDVRRVWREAYRVLKHKGRLLSGFTNPIVYLFDMDEHDKGHLVVKNKIPYSDVELLSAEEISKRYEKGEPLEFGHTLDDQIGGQIASGFVITGFYEDKCDETDLLSNYIASYMATRADKMD